ncbi:breast cancer type 1 susceptibility protein homolog isoform X1 [Nothobranchius furzeri]|uniref:RING-type E3 ubiquitin transferase BRCA1 n=1 Tax=Nothobranchius furzeri TaxID=105023 RepID=A0A1A8B9C8_NOTFU|nr:transcript variant X1 [Nothobranchius furzeri]KAF7204355.1 transcript variant X2 [Nothobranchius furzeri]
MESQKVSDVKKRIAVLWETLKCPICLDLMTAPMSTKCNHQFCKFCIKKLLENSKQNRASCPVCKSRITKRSLQESPGFQRLVAGLQDMIQAYEQDTCTNYFTGLSHQKQHLSIRNAELAGNSCTMLSGGTFATNQDYTTNDDPPKSSSTVEAQNGFAKLMGLEDSGPLMMHNEGPDSAPTTSDEKMASPKDHLETRAAAIGVKVMRTTRSKKKCPTLENAPPRPVLAGEKTGCLRKPTRNEQKTDLESDEVLEQKKKKSLEKVAEWLLKVPAEDELEKPRDNGDDSDSCLSASVPDADLVLQKEDRTKALEEQVFGAVYKRKSGKGFKPSTTSETLTRKRISKKNTTTAKEQQTVENLNDASSDFFKEVEQKKVDTSKNTNGLSVHDSKEPSLPPGSDVLPGTVTRRRARKALLDVDGDLQEQARPKSDSSEQRRPNGRKGKNVTSEKNEPSKVAKPLVLVGIQNRDSSPKARGRSEDVQVQIETYPSSEGQEPSSRSTRGTKRLHRFVEEVQDSHKKTMKTNLLKKNRRASNLPGGKTVDKSPPDSRNAAAAAQRNGCVYQEDIGGIENMEMGEKRPPEAVVDCSVSVVPNSISDASVLGPTENSPNNLHQEVSAPEAPAGMENVDGELDTEQLLMSFKSTKRKSFILGEPKVKRSRHADKAEDKDAGESSPAKMSRETPEASQDAEKSPHFDHISPSNSPNQTARAAKRELTVVEASIPDGLSSGLSPNKVSKHEGASSPLSVVPQVGDSGLRFMAVEPEPKGPQTNEGPFGSTVGDQRTEVRDTKEHFSVAESSVTPEVLMVPALQIVHKDNCSGEASAHSSIRTDLRKKKKAQKLESSSESDGSGSKEELPTLTQIFGTSTRLPAGTEDQGDSRKADGGEEGQTDAAEPRSPPAECPSPDCINSSQASVDLFGTPDERDVPENEIGVSIESSQFSNEVLVTQQKLEMQKELARLGKLMALVTEVLQEKEGSPERDVPSESCQGGKDAGEDDPKAMMDEPNPDQESCRKNIPDAEEDPNTKPPGDNVVTEPGLWRHGGVTQTPEQHSAQKSAKHSNPSTSSDATKTMKKCDSPSDGQDDKENTSPPIDRCNAKLVLVSSGLGPAEQMMVKKFAKGVGARMVSHVTSEVTHVVIRTDEQLVCERTLKYFLGIAGRKWVVGFRWISECFKHKKLLEESPFEVRGDVVNGPNHQGPSRARNTEDSNLLMKGYKICFQGPFTDMSTDEMEWMVELCGATVVKDPLQLDSKQKSHHLIVVQPRPESSPSTYKSLSKNATVVTRGWLLDTVATYTLQNYSSYAPLRTTVL